MVQQRGSVVHCSRFGCIVKLEDGRFALLPANEDGIDTVRRAAGLGRHPQFPFYVVEEDGRRVRLKMALERRPEEASQKQLSVAARLSASLEHKIIDFWRQASEWDRNAGRVEEEEPVLRRADRLLPFEERTRKQQRESPKRPRRPKR